MFILRGLFRTSHGIFVYHCNAKLEPLVSIMMPVTATKSIKVIAAVAYKEPIKSLILAKKWADTIACTKLAHIRAKN